MDYFRDFSFWKIHNYHIHLSTHSENHYTKRKICILGYLAKQSSRLILQRIEENCIFWPCVFVTDNRSVKSDYWVLVLISSLICKFWLISLNIILLLYFPERSVNSDWDKTLVRIYWAKLRSQYFWLDNIQSLNDFYIKLTCNFKKLKMWPHHSNK